jgi:ureidoglycolate lyase
MTSMIEIVARPLDAKSFAPYGELLSPPPDGGRAYFDERLQNLRETAWPSISIARPAAAIALPFLVTRLERHAFSSQSFVPIDARRWLVVVAPHAADGGPDASRLEAFLAGPDQGITYAADTWHHPLTAIEETASFALIMWRDGTAGDEEFFELPQPVRIV